MRIAPKHPAWLGNARFLDFRASGTIAAVQVDRLTPSQRRGRPELGITILITAARDTVLCMAARRDQTPCMWQVNRGRPRRWLRVKRLKPAAFEYYRDPQRNRGSQSQPAPSGMSAEERVSAARHPFPCRDPDERERGMEKNLTANKSQIACESRLAIFCHQIVLPYPFRDCTEG